MTEGDLDFDPRVQIVGRLRMYDLRAEGSPLVESKGVEGLGLVGVVPDLVKLEPVPPFLQ